MIEKITTAFSTFSADLVSIAGVVLPIAAGPLIMFIGMRLVRKLINNGIGK